MKKLSLEELHASLLGDWEASKLDLTFGVPAYGAYSVRQPSSDATNALTLIGGKLLDEFGDLIYTAVTNEIPGHVVETGVWRGGACIWAAAVLEELGSDKMVYVCDSFCGLPPPTHPKETIDFTSAESLKVSLDEVRRNFERYGLEHKAIFVQGWFKDTMPTLDIPVSVLRLDGDMYESTMDVLKYMYDRVSPGGYVIVDDYQLPSCRAAVDEFRSSRHVRGGLKVRAGTWWQK